MHYVLVHGRTDMETQERPYELGSARKK